MDYAKLYKSSDDYDQDFAERYYLPKQELIHQAVDQLTQLPECQFRVAWMSLHVPGLNSRHFSVVESICREYYRQKKTKVAIATSIDDINASDASDADLQAIGDECGFVGYATQVAVRRGDLLLKHPNTYQVKSEIKFLGGKWMAGDRGWQMPNQDAFNQALAACESARQ